ncbi:ATP-binding protein [Phycicoccus endophyticus]|nr:ATP-binding protein [Phycicoccus endophyticus]
MSERSGWMVTTHDWSDDLDTHHLALVRENAAVYGAGGLRHMILEVLAYANDEAEARCSVGLAVVSMTDDGTVTIADDGRGTDTRLDQHGKAVRKPVMATRDIRFFDVADGPTLPDGLPRRGMSTVAALSSVLVHENRRSNGTWTQTYRYGIPDAALHALPRAPRTGTVVTFRPDARIGGPTRLMSGDARAFPWLRLEMRDRG